MSEKKDLTFEQIMKALEEAKPSWMADGKGLRGDAPKYKPLEMPRGEIGSRTALESSKRPTPDDLIPPCVKLRGLNLTYSDPGITGCGCFEAVFGILSFSVTDFTFLGGTAVWNPDLGLWVDENSLVATYNAWRDDVCSVPNTGEPPGSASPTEPLEFTTFIQCAPLDGKAAFRVLITGTYASSGGAPSTPNGWPGSGELGPINSVGWLAFSNEVGGRLPLGEDIPNDYACPGDSIGGGLINLSATAP